MDEVIVNSLTAEEIENWMIEAHNESGLGLDVTYIPPAGRKVIAQHILARLNGSRVHVLNRIKDQSHGD